MNDAYSDDERYPNLELADYVHEIYLDDEQRPDWEIAIPEIDSYETECTWDEVEAILEDDVSLESPTDFFNHCKHWRTLSYKVFKRKAIELSEEDQSFTDNVDFEGLYKFLKDDYNN